MQVSALLRVENSFTIATDMQMQAIDAQAVAMTLAAWCVLARPPCRV